MFFSFITHGYKPQWNVTGVSCTGTLGIPSEASADIAIMWRPNLQPEHSKLDGAAYALVEQSFYRARLWGALTPIYPYMLRNRDDWGVAWQLWRMWYEYSQVTGGNGLRGGGVTRPLYFTEGVAELLSRRYDDPDKDMNWCRFVQLVTSRGWNKGHAPFLNGYLLTWLLYVGNAPRRDVVYTTEASGTNASAQSTDSWFNNMRIQRKRSGNLDSIRDKSAIDVLRTYQKLMAELSQAYRASQFRGNFAKHVLEFEL